MSHLSQVPLLIGKEGGLLIEKVMQYADVMKKIPAHIPAGSSCKPKIDYPCEWQYKIIGESATVITELVADIVHEKDYSLTRSNVSRAGRYISMSLELTVATEERRLELYRLLGENPTVKVVL